MLKDAPISVRLPHVLREALNAAAASDQRTLAGLVTKVLIDWAMAEGWLKVDGRGGLTAVTERRHRQTPGAPRRRNGD